MAQIVTLREKSDNELQEMLETAREEMFNLRFRQATSGVKDTSQLKKVRREMAQIRTVLNERQQAVEAASQEPVIADLLAERAWSASARFDYVESAWLVEFVDDDETKLASARVNLNRKRSASRRGREDRLRREPQLVLAYEIAE